MLYSVIIIAKWFRCYWVFHMYRLLLLGLLLCMEKSFSSVVVLFLYGLKLCATEGYCWSNVFFFKKKNEEKCWSWSSIEDLLPSLFLYLSVSLCLYLCLNSYSIGNWPPVLTVCWQASDNTGRRLQIRLPMVFEFLPFYVVGSDILCQGIRDAVKWRKRCKVKVCLHMTNDLSVKIVHYGQV